MFKILLDTGLVMEHNVMLYKYLNKISGNLYPNNQNNQLERRAWPPRDVPLDAQS